MNPAYTVGGLRAIAPDGVVRMSVRSRYWLFLLMPFLALIGAGVLYPWIGFAGLFLVMVVTGVVCSTGLIALACPKCGTSILFRNGKIWVDPTSFPETCPQCGTRL